jgi:EmrB/QacA subfamily drug resistance transporter
MMMIDQTVLPLALPTIQRQLLLSNVMLQWTVNAYILGVAATVLAGGRLADLVGRRRIFTIGIILFAVASISAGLSIHGWWLILSRGLQGIGAAMMGPAAVALIIDIFPPGQRGRVMGIYVASAALFLSLGPIIGGFFTNYLSWRWIFWMNVPISLMGLALGIGFVSPSEALKAPLRENFSFATYLSLAFGIIFLVVWLMQGGAWGWSSFLSITSILLSLFSWITFYILDKKEKNPAIDLELFRVRTFFGSCVVIFALQLIVMVTVFWGLYFQNILGCTPMQAGWITSISALPVLILPVVAGHISDRFGPRIPICLGLGLMFFCFIWFATHKDTTSYHVLVPALLAFGCGIGLINSPVNTSALSTVPPAKRGVASGTTSAVRWLGGTAGVALLGSVLNSIQFHAFESLLAENPMTAKLDPYLFEGLFSRKYGATSALNQLKAGAAKWVEGSLHDSFLVAFRAMNLTAAMIAFAVLVLTFFWLRPSKTSI